MKRMIFAALAILSFGTQASDEVITIDGKQAAITSIGNIVGSAEKSIDVKTLQSGVYIIAETGMGGNRLPNAEAIISERFAAAGIPISKTLDGSAMAVTFWSGGSLDLVRAEQAQAQGLNSGKIAGGIAAAAGGMASAGVSGGAGALVGLLIPQDEKAVVTGMVREKPFMNKGWLGSSLRSSVDGGEYANQIEMQYSLPDAKDKQATQDVMLKIVVDQWIKRYVAAK